MRSKTANQGKETDPEKTVKMPKKRESFEKIKMLTLNITLNILLGIVPSIEDQRGSQFLLGILAAAALGHTSEPVDANSQEDVDNDVDPHDAKVAPGIFVVADHLSKEDIG